jgi:hypothetical protein
MKCIKCGIEMVYEFGDEFVDQYVCYVCHLIFRRSVEIVNDCQFYVPM